MGQDIENTLYKFKAAEELIPAQQEEFRQVQDQNLQKDIQKQDNAMSFADMTAAMALIDQKGSYTFKDGNNFKVAERETRANSSMSKVIDALKELNDTFNKEIDKENLTSEDVVTEAQKPFLKVCEACRTYLKRHKKRPWSAEGRARRQMIEDLLEQTTQESIEFYERVKSYREDGIPENVSTWKDVLADVRTENIETEKDGARIEMGGAGTSSIHIIKTKDENGKTVKRFFKEDELNVSEDYKDAFQKQIEKFDTLSKDQKKTGNDSGKSDNEEVRDLLKEVLSTCKKMDQAQVLNSFTQKNVKEGKNIYQNLRIDFSEKYYVLNDKMEDLEKSKPNVMQKLYSALWTIRQDFQLGGAAEHACIKKGSNITKRNAATTRLADMLGISNVVVKSKMARVNINGEKMHGVIMEEAKGENLTFTLESDKKEQPKFTSVSYSDEAYRDLLNLQILDIICGQIDRHFNNIRGEIKTKGKSAHVSSIKGIDNDLSFGTVKFKDLCTKGIESNFNTRKITDENGKFALPAVEAEMWAKIQALDEQDLRFKMADLLDEDELDALIDRVKGVKKLIGDAIADAEKNNKKLLIGKDDMEQWAASQAELNKKVQDKNDPTKSRLFRFTYLGPYYTAKGK